MIVDPNKVAGQRKRSSLRQNNLFNDSKDPHDPHKNKSLKWDAHVEEQTVSDAPRQSSDRITDILVKSFS